MKQDSVESGLKLTVDKFKESHFLNYKDTEVLMK